MIKNTHYSYRGSDSKNSILGNKIRNKINHLLVKATTRSKLSPKQALEILKKHGFKGKITSGKVAKASLGNRTVEIPKNGINEYILNHEIGHLKAVSKPNSFNRRFLSGDKKNRVEHLLDKKNLSSRFKIDDEDFDNNYEKVNRVIRELKGELTNKVEQEAWIEGRKLQGKESLKNKITRKAAIGTYNRKNEQLLQEQRYKSDPEFREKLKIRTAKKVGGLIAGATAGNLVTSALLKKLKIKLKQLEKKESLTLEEKLLKKSLKRKLMLYKVGGTLTGAGGGYYLTKKYLT